MALTALAGPISNVLLAMVALLLYGALFGAVSSTRGIAAFFLETLYYTAYISCALAVLNIIPIPPLDGSKVLFAFLPDDVYMKLMRYERYGFILLIILIYTNTMTPFLSTATNGLFDFLAGFIKLTAKVTV